MKQESINMFDLLEENAQKDSISRVTQFTIKNQDVLGKGIHISYQKAGHLIKGKVPSLGGVLIEIPGEYLSVLPVLVTKDILNRTSEEDFYAGVEQSIMDAMSRISIADLYGFYISAPGSLLDYMVEKDDEKYRGIYSYFWHKQYRQ